MLPFVLFGAFFVYAFRDITSWMTTITLIGFTVMALVFAALLKAIRLEYPNYELWREFAYEYETERLAIDLLSGGTFLRDWVDDAGAKASDFDERLTNDERNWAETRAPYLIY